MKKSLALIVLMAWSAITSAQVVTTIPAFPTQTGSVTLNFNASQGNKGIENYTGDVYVHTGVITDKSTSNTDWKYVKTSWGQNTPETKLTRTGTNSYQLIIANPRTYYNVSANDKIVKLAFVLRSGVQVGGSYKEGKDVGGLDILVSIYDSNLNVRFENPSEDITIVEKNVEVPILAIVGYTGTASLTMKLLVNGEEKASVENDTLSTNVTLTQDGVNKLTVIAFDSNGVSDTAHTQLLVAPSVPELPRPTLTQDGINYISDSKVVLSLFAPKKQFVYVIGDFNDFKIENEYLMNKETHNADSVWYWIEIDNLTPETEYAFQYLVDGKLRVADPYSTKVLDPNDDKYIPKTTYPNLKPYPTDKTKFQVGVLQPGKPAFNWQITNFQKPKPEELVIYELLVRDFVATRSYKTLIDTLDYIKRLGFNAIELMPIMEFEGNESWGYNPSFHLAVDKYYGTENDLKLFIDACHKKGIAVILDMVLNHAFGQSPLVRLWNTGDYGAPTAENPYLNTVARHDYNVGYDFNHESYATKYFVDRVNSHWLKEFKFDGFRFDLSKGFTQKNTLGNVGLWGQRDDSRIAILKRMNDKIKEVDPSAYVILEHFADNSEEIILSNAGMMLWNNQNNAFMEASMGFMPSSNFSSLAWNVKGWSNPLAVGYMESHDEERMMYKNITYGASNGTYTVKNLDIALERVKLSSAFFFLVPGPKMAWQFGELGYDISIDFNGRVGNKPLKWEYYAQENRLKVYKTWQALLALRHADEAFSSKSTNISMNVAGALKSITLKNAEMNAYIIGNFGTSTATMNLTYPSTGVWYDYFSGQTIQVPETSSSISLNPGEFYVYTTKQFDLPEQGLFTANESELNNENPVRFALNPNYPNPFNPSTTISFDMMKTGFVDISVFDILGRKVATLENGIKSQGSHTVQFDASRLSSGMYLVKMQVGSQVFIQKATLLK